MFMIYLSYYFVKIVAEGLEYTIIFVIYYFIVEDQPFCVPGEISFFGWDMCAAKFMHGGMTD